MQIRTVVSEFCTSLVHVEERGQLVASMCATEACRVKLGLVLLQLILLMVPGTAEDVHTHDNHFEIESVCVGGGGYSALVVVLAPGTVAHVTLRI